MFIETTINLNTHALLLINTAARMSGKTRSNLIVLLMRRIMKDGRDLVRNNRIIQYQEELPKERWHRLHVSLYSSDYECFLDLRKFYKRSVSLLVSLAIDRYLNEIIDSSIREPITIIFKTIYLLLVMPAIQYSGQYIGGFQRKWRQYSYKQRFVIVLLISFPL